MAAPTSTNEVTARKLSSSISALWTKIKSTFQPVADRVTSWSSTPSDAKYPSEKLVKDSLDGIAGDYRTKLQDASKGGNLVVNGNGVLGTNYNFGARTFIGNTDLPNGNAGCFRAVANTIWHDEPIAVDVGKTYEAEVWYRVKSANTSTVRFSVCCFDVDDNEISAIFCTFGVGTLTELTQDLKPGDTVVHLADLSGDGWLSETDYHHGFIFWNYQNSLGYTYPQETYSRNVYPRGYVYLWDNSSAVNVAAGTITLKSAWNGPTIPAGTKVSRRNSGNNYYYVDYTQNASASTSWEKLSGKISGGAFRPGTAYLKIGFYNSNTTTNEYIEFTGMSLRELPAKLATARKLKTNLARTADSTFDGSADQTNIPVTGTLPVGNGGTGKTTAKAAEYNLTTGKSEISDTTSGDDRVVFELASPSESNGVTRGFRKLSTIWTWIKGLLSSESGVNISGSSASCTGNAATATTAKDYDTNSGTIKSALAGKSDTGHVHNTDANDVTDSAAASTLDVVTDTTEIVTTNTNGYTSNDKKLYRRPAGSKIWPWIQSKIESDSGLVHTTGDETIQGLKTFSNTAAGNDLDINLQSVTNNGTYKMGVEVAASGRRGLWDYGGTGIAGENKWIVYRDTDGITHVGGASDEPNTIRIGKLTIDTSGTIGSASNTLYIG